MVNPILKLLLILFFCIMYDTESVFCSKLEQTYTNFCPTVVLWDNRIMGNWGWRRFLAILKVNPFLLLVYVHDVWPETRQDFISVIYLFYNEAETGKQHSLSLVKAFTVVKQHCQTQYLDKLEFLENVIQKYAFKYLQWTEGVRNYLEEFCSMKIEILVDNVKK